MLDLGIPNNHLGPRDAPGPTRYKLAISEKEPTQIRVETLRISYRNEDNGWTVLRARNCDDQTELTATGHFASIHQGGEYEFFGTWGKHPQYGPQFKIERSVELRPTTRAGIERYLASGMIKGIGPKTASKIVDLFGDHALDILDAAPERLSEVPTIGEKKVQAIIDGWKEQRGVANVMMFLSTHGISPLFAARIYKFYGADAVSIISKDPYRLAVDIQGVGFISADRVARSMGIAADSIERIRAAILFQLQQAEDKGHCYVTTKQLTNMLVESLMLSEEKIVARLADCINELNDLGSIITEKIVSDDGERISAHFRSDILVAEWNIAHSVKKLLQTSLESDPTRVDAWVKKYCEAAGTPLSEEQTDAVRKAVSQRFFILTGGPGVGKTTTANTIIRLLKAMGKNVLLAAPTGRAAQRLTEVAASPAKTIHRLLEWVPNLHSFARNENNPLTAQAVIVDEASMLDIRLADALIRAVPSNAQLILIGDVDQLPSVGPGNVLRDLIDSGQIPCTRLTQIFRQAAHSRIVQAAHAINSGRRPDITDDRSHDCQFIEVDSGDELKDTLLKMVRHVLPREFKFDPVQDIQILTPMNRGDLGTITLNTELQNLLNPLKPDMFEYKRGNVLLRPGDKVIQSVNNYDLGVFNGDIGYVVNTKVDGGKLIVSFGDDRVITYEDDQAIDLRLAYAITIHKSQGSEFPVVIIPCSMQHYIMLQRNLTYTALTRARKMAIFVGSRKALNYSIDNQVSITRQTSLIDKIHRALHE